MIWRVSLITAQMFLWFRSGKHWTKSGAIRSPQEYFGPWRISPGQQGSLHLASQELHSGTDMLELWIDQ